MEYVYLFAKKLCFLLFFSAALLFSMNSEAWHAHGGGLPGGYYHGGGYHDGGYYNHGYYGYGNRYYGAGFGGPGVYVGVPGVGYYGGGCSYVQRCSYNGCISERVCY